MESMEFVGKQVPMKPESSVPAKIPDLDGWDNEKLHALIKPPYGYGCDLLEYKFLNQFDHSVKRLAERVIVPNPSIKVNHVILMVGGRNVYVYDCRDPCCVFREGPPLIAPKYMPILMSIGSLLFAISSRLWENPPSLELDPAPRFEILDVENMSAGWASLPQPEETCLPVVPVTPFHARFYRERYELDRYFIVGYAAYAKGRKLFFTFSEILYSKSRCAASYDIDRREWTFSKAPLPFYNEAKFVGDLCYGFSSDESVPSTYISLYRFDDRSFKFTPLAAYRTLSSSPFNYRHHIRTFFPLKEDIITIIQAEVDGHEDFHQTHYLSSSVIKVDFPHPSDGSQSFIGGTLIGNATLIYSKSYWSRLPIHDIVSPGGSI